MTVYPANIHYVNGFPCVSPNSCSTSTLKSTNSSSVDSVRFGIQNFAQARFGDNPDFVISGSNIGSKNQSTVWLSSDLARLICFFYLSDNLGSGITGSGTVSGFSHRICCFISPNLTAELPVKLQKKASHLSPSPVLLVPPWSTPPSLPHPTPPLLLVPTSTVPSSSISFQPTSLGALPLLSFLQVSPSTSILVL